MKRYLHIFLILMFAVLSTDAVAQKWKLRRYELTGGVGTLHYFGTIGGSADETNLFGLKDIDIGSSRPSFYGGVRYKIRKNIAVKGNFIWGYIHGDDEGSRNAERNAAFTSRIIEPSAQLEISLISEEQKYRSSALFNRRGMINNYSRFNLYIYGGFGGVLTKVSPLKDIELHPDYDDSKLNSSTIGILGGAGLKYVISSDLSVGAEFGARMPVTFYLDGLHTSSAAPFPDVYYALSINVIYRVRTDRNNRPIIFRRTSRGMF